MFTAFFKMTTQPFAESVAVQQILKGERMSQAERDRGCPCG